MSEEAGISYWPEGWDRERLLNAEATGELEQISQDQMFKIRRGLVQELGEDGFSDFLAEMEKRTKQANSTSVPSPPASEPPFMETIRLCEERTGRHWESWGYVVFKSPDIRDSDAWTKCQQRFEQIINESVAPYRGYPGLDSCLSRMRIQWIEDTRLASASIASVAAAALHEEIITRGSTLMSVNGTPGLNHSLCLYITPASLNSIIDSPLPSTLKRQDRKTIPFVVAISGAAASFERVQNGDEFSEVSTGGWRGFFNVAVESLLTTLFPAVADGMLSPSEIGEHVHGDDIWCDTTRWGIHKAGVGYYDRRLEQASTGI